MGLTKSQTILCEIRVKRKITGFSKWRHLHYTYEIVLRKLSSVFLFFFFSPRFFTRLRFLFVFLFFQSSFFIPLRSFRIVLSPFVLASSTLLYALVRYCVDDFFSSTLSSFFDVIKFLRKRCCENGKKGEKKN